MLIGGSLKNNNSILITGGAGFLGSHLVDTFLEKGNRISIIDNLSTTSKSNHINPEAEFIQMDINDTNLKKTIKKINPKIIIHCASQTSVSMSSRNPKKDAENNILGTLNLLESFYNSQDYYFVFISTGGAIYGENTGLSVGENHPCSPKSPYGLIRMKHLIVRPANIFGPRQNPHGEAGVVSIFANSMLNNQNVSIFGDGNDYRDYVYVNDVVNFIEKAIEKNASGVFNVGTGISITTNKVFSDLAEILNYTKKPNYLPKRPGDIKGITLDSKKALKENGFHAKDVQSPPDKDEPNQ